MMKIRHPLFCRNIAIFLLCKYLKVAKRFYFDINIISKEWERSVILMMWSVVKSKLMFWPFFQLREANVLRQNSILSVCCWNSCNRIYVSKSSELLNPTFLAVVVPWNHCFLVREKSESCMPRPKITRYQF